MRLSFNHPPPGPGYRYSEAAARSLVGQTFPVHVAQTTVQGTALDCEFIAETGGLLITVEVPDDTPHLDALGMGTFTIDREA